MEAKEVHTISTSPLVTSPFALEWSEDDRISLVTEKQLHITTNHRHSSSMYHKMLLVLMVSLMVVLPTCSSTDITSAVFGNVRDVLPAAFGDFDSDELTDMFVTRNDRRTLEIMLASDQEPFLRSNETLRCSFKDSTITGVVPGDFDGDALMDVLVTTKISGTTVRVYIMWGGMHHLNCSSDEQALFEMSGEPLAIDYNGDMIIDLFGLDEKSKVRTFWIFHRNRTFTKVPLDVQGLSLSDLRPLHSHAFLDMNDDYAPDLVLTSVKGLEFWYADKESFRFNRSLPYPQYIKSVSQSQTLFLDVSMRGTEDILLPVCTDLGCYNSQIFIHSQAASTQWCNLNVGFADNTGKNWGFIKAPPEPYTDAITLRGGDFNMDGYPDLLATLQQVPTSGEPVRKSFLLKNVPCVGAGCCFGRTFEVQWNTLEPMNYNTNLAVFYDFGQDGTLDVLFVHKESTGTYGVSVFKNSLDYDANFMKVMVLTGLTNGRTPPKTSSLSRKKVKTFGSNLPGPSISYQTQTQEGTKRVARSSQLPQSAYCPLGLPYSIFGLGRTPNFIDLLSVGLTGKSREWTQIIPNSQMLVIPVNPVDPSTWKAQLFVTPSKLVFMSVAALLATCAVITLIILGLYWKERRQDKRERLQEAHRFHFDAM